MLQISSLPENSIDNRRRAEEGGSGPASDGFKDERGVVSAGEEVGDRNFNGNRWPPEETTALLKIRSDMDVAFRDATTPKVRLWEQVSRSVVFYYFEFLFSIPVTTSCSIKVPRECCKFMGISKSWFCTLEVLFCECKLQSVISLPIPSSFELATWSVLCTPTSNSTF